MAEVVVTALLSSAFQALFDWLKSPEVLQFFRNNDHSLAKLLDNLDSKLSQADALLNDAEDKQIMHVGIKNWVDDINEVIHKADDIIDEINTKFFRLKNKESTIESLKLKLRSKFNDKTRSLEDVIKRLDSLLERKDSLGLIGGFQSKRFERVEASLIDNPDNVCGRNEDKDVIVKLVLSENVKEGNDKISVIPIVGMGGIGKTTLARLVYDDDKVKAHFENKCAWVTVSDDFDVWRLKKLIFKELTSDEPRTEDSGKLKEELKKKLGGKKFLLVLDDIWNENYIKWDNLRSFLEMRVPGVKIIITTRNLTIARIMGDDVQFHHLKEISDEYCWELFKKKAFRTKNPDVELAEIGRDIVKKCKGLPLAVMSIAGLLRSTSNPEDWKEVLESDIWELQKKGTYDILPSLWLSYSYLPSHLKRCFAYCSIFPKDYEYEEKKIILLWMAEGLIQGENKERTGEKCIEDLVSGSLFQRSTKTEAAFVMHDLVHDLASFAYGRDFCLRLDKSNGVNITNKTRHLLFGGDLPDLEIFKMQLSKAKCLRTLLRVENRNEYNDNIDVLLKEFEFLRVLGLFKSTIKKVPSSVKNLKHLRYLDLSYTKIQELPDTICSLYNLQTLLLCRCDSLTELPRNIKKLVNLRHLDISGTKSLKKMPRGICNLKSLRSLPKFALSKEESACRLNELLELSNLSGKLKIECLENVVSVEDVRKALLNKKFITNLRLCWSGGSETNEYDQLKEREVLDALQPHHSNMKIFMVKGYSGKQFSNWVGDLSSFSKVTQVVLSNCKHCCHLPPLGNLPSLSELSIRDCHSIEMISSEFYGSSNINYIPFKSLKRLEISGMKAWKSWLLNGDGELKKRAFPCLKVLLLYRCPKLNTPLLHCFPSLVELWISDCGEMETLLPSGQAMNNAFPSLESLRIDTSPTLEFSGILPFPSSLKSLDLNDCVKLLEQRMQWGLKALKRLVLWDCGDVELGDSFPEEDVFPSTLTYVRIENAQNLKGLNGKVFQQLTSLTELKLSKCPELSCFPEG